MYAKSNEDSKNGSLNYIKDIYPQAKNLQMKVIVLHVGNSYKTKDGLEVRSCKVADKTGAINLSIWGEHGAFIQPGDILALSRCYAVLFKNCLTLYVGKLGSLTKVGDFCMVFSEVPDISEPNQEWIQQQNQDGKNSQGNQPGSTTQSSAHQPKQTNPKSNNFRAK